MRKWIDLLNELQMFDPEKFITTDDGGTLPPLAPKEDGGEPNGKKVYVFDIIWDTDDAPNLPTEISFPLDELDEVPWPSEGGGPDGDMMTRVGDWLTHNVHACLSNFDFYVR